MHIRSKIKPSKILQNRIILIFFGILFLGLQIPFLSADPDFTITESRDANTDEGLYACQVSNYINHHDLTFKKTDGMVKAPLFSAVLFIPLKIFGTRLIVGRLTVLLLSLTLCLLLFSMNVYNSQIGLFSFGILLSSYYIFHYFHISLAEILASVFILISIFLLYESWESKFSLKYTFLSAAALSSAYYLKIQFVYSIVILPASLLLLKMVIRGNAKLWLKQCSYTVLFLVIFLVLYILIWYLPHKEFFDDVMASQTADRMIHLSGLFDHMNLFLHHYFYNEYIKFYTVCFYGLFFIGLLFLFFTKSSRYKFLFIGLSCWVLVEVHKLALDYLPPRYLVSLLFAMGILMALVINELIFLKGKMPWNYILKSFSVVLFLYICITNGTNYISMYKSRTFQIATVNKYLSQYDFKESPVIGAWAASLCWDCKAITFPVWKDYFNDTDVVEKYKPAVIIAEFDEEDSNQAFSSRGIDLDVYADSIRYYKINRWNLKLLWIHPYNKDVEIKCAGESL